MGKRRFTATEIEELLKNKHIMKCSEKSITYANDFKIMVVKQYREEGMFSKEIFMNAGFDLEVIGKDTPKQCLKRWNKTYKRKGLRGLAEARGERGGRPKVKDLTDKDRIKRLETEVAYLKAENDFLAKLRAKRRE